MEGCLLTTTSATFPSNTNYEIPWNAQVQFGTESFWSSGARLVIPAGVNGDLVEFFGMHAASGAGGTGMDGNTLLQRASPGVINLTGFQHDNMRWSPFAHRTGMFQVATAEEFRMLYRTFGSTGACNRPRTKFGCIVNPHEHLLGIAQAEAASDVSTTAGILIDWATPAIDTLSTWASGNPSLFTAPTGAVAAVATLTSQSTSFVTSFETFAMDKNLSQINVVNYDTQGRGGWVGTWLTDISAGDTLRFYQQRDGTMDASQTWVNIEWYG